MIFNLDLPSCVDELLAGLGVWKSASIGLTGSFNKFRMNLNERLSPALEGSELGKAP